MADEKTSIDIELNGHDNNFTKILDDATKKMKAFQSSLSKTEKTVESLVDNFNSLANVDMSKLQTATALQNIGPNRSFVNTLGVGATVIRDGDRGDIRRANAIISAQTELARAQSELISQIAELKRQKAEGVAYNNAHADEILSNKTKFSEGFYNNSLHALINAEADKQYRLVSAKYKQFKMDNPELFEQGAKLRTPSHQFGNALGEIGHYAGQNLGTFGKFLGSALEILGSGLKIGPIGAAATAVSLLGKSITDFARNSTEAYAQIESIKTQLSVVMGSDVQSEILYKNISQYAIKSPFGITQTSELATLLKQSGVYATDLMETLKMLGDTAGGNMEKMKRIANNYAQIVSIGKASMLDMRQFAYAGIPIFEAVSKELKVSQAQLRKLISDGKVTADIVEKVFKDLTGVNGTFENATQKGAETLKARLQNLNDIKAVTLASLGENIVNFGKSYDRESKVFNLVSVEETFYEAIKKWSDTANIERNVDIIANRDNRLQELISLRDKAEKDGDKELKKYYDNLIKDLISKRNIEEERKSLNAAFENRNRENEDVKKVYDRLNMKEGGFVDETLLSTGGKVGLAGLSYVNNLLYLLGSYVATAKSKSLISAPVDDVIAKNLKETSLEQFQQMKDFWYIAWNSTKEISETMVLASKQVQAELFQQSAFDSVNKNATSQGSGKNIMSDISQAVENTPEAKQKALEDKIELWNKVIANAGTIYNSQNALGNIDFSKLGYRNLLNFNKSGYFTGEKLTITENKSAEEMARSRKTLESQYSDVTKWIDVLAKNSGIKDYGKILNSINDYFMIDYHKDENNIEFFNSFDKAISEQVEAIDELAKQTNDPKTLDLLQDIKTLIGLSTLKLSSNTDNVVGQDAAALLEPTKKKADAFIPLWKRLVSGATGISASAIGDNGLGTTLNNYKNDMAVRGIASNMFTAMLKNGASVSSIQNLIATKGDSKVLRGTNTPIYQADWENTRKNLKLFAMQLSASTDVISAYKSGLESELDVYNKLLTTALTSAETSDITGQKTVSVKKLGDMTSDQGEQLVNSMGESLKAANGEVVAYIKDGNAYNKDGIKIWSDQLVITGKLFEWLEKEIPALRDEIKEAEEQRSKNELLNKASSEASSPMLFNEILKKFLTDPSAVNFLGNNESYILEKAKANLDESKKDSEYFKNRSGQDIINAANGYVSTGDNIDDSLMQEEAIRLLAKAINELVEWLNTVVENSGLINDYNNINTQNAANEVLKNLQGSESSKSFSTLMKEGLAQNSSLGKSLSKNGMDIRGWGSAVETLAKDENFRSNVKISDKVNHNDAKELEEAYRKAADQAMRVKLANIDIVNSLTEMVSSVSQLSVEFGKAAFTSTFESLGEALVTGADASASMEEKLRGAVSAMMKGIGAAMTTAGFQIAGAAAVNQNWLVAGAGLALAASGGIVSGVGSGLGSISEEDGSELEHDMNSQYEKLNSLKDDLLKILDQARSDSLYYEMNLRHKQALGVSGNVSSTSVHDALIDTNGKIITTDPKDYLIATKNPQQLVGGGVGNVVVQPQITIMPINNSRANVNVRTEQTVNEDGSIEVLAYIEDAVGSYIASSRSDDAFNARSFRINGHQSVM